MEITSDELLAEAGQMALHIRLLERDNARLEAENTDLKTQLAAQSDPAGDGKPA